MHPPTRLLHLLHTPTHTFPHPLTPLPPSWLTYSYLYAPMHSPTPPLLHIHPPTQPLTHPFCGRSIACVSDVSPWSPAFKLLLTSLEKVEYSHEGKCCQAKLPPSQSTMHHSSTNTTRPHCCAQKISPAQEHRPIYTSRTKCVCRKVRHDKVRKFGDYCAWVCSSIFCLAE